MNRQVSDLVDLGRDEKNTLPISRSLKLRLVTYHVAIAATAGTGAADEHADEPTTSSG